MAIFKYRFTLLLQDKYMKESCNLMKNLDCDIGEVGNQEVFMFSSDKDHDIPKLKEALKNAIESVEINVLHIEGGKVE